jgi:hypothetical protein
VQPRTEAAIGDFGSSQRPKTRLMVFVDWSRYTATMSDLASSPDDFPAFSVFRALRVERHEVRHSNFLAWLIDPRESHGQGPLFSRFFLQTVARVVGEGHSVRAKLETFEASTSAIEVSREADRLDLRVVLPQAKVVIGVENKVFASEHSGQLSRYAESIRGDFPDWDSALLYLTLDGDPPSDARWLPLTHRHVLAMIEDGIDRLRPGTPPAVRIFIEHYVELLRDLYSTRIASKAIRHVQQSCGEVDLRESPKDSVADEKLAGWDKFDALMRKVIRVPKADVDKLIAEEKAARIERRRARNKPS